MGFAYRRRPRAGRDEWLNISNSGGTVSGHSGRVAFNRGAGRIRLGQRWSFKSATEAPPPRRSDDGPHDE
jgi:hypothetical protein